MRSILERGITIIMFHVLPHCIQHCGRSDGKWSTEFRSRRLISTKQFRLPLQKCASHWKLSKIFADWMKQLDNLSKLDRREYIVMGIICIHRNIGQAHMSHCHRNHNFQNAKVLTEFSSHRSFRASGLNIAVLKIYTYYIYDNSLLAYFGFWSIGLTRWVLAPK